MDSERTLLRKENIRIIEEFRADIDQMGRHPAIHLLSGRSSKPAAPRMQLLETGYFQPKLAHCATQPRLMGA